jgi:tRNA (guanine-N7-)-methyltransferase
MTAKKHQEKFYGRRKGQKLSARKEQLLKEILPRVSISMENIEPGGLDPRTLFDFTSTQVWLEIGFGKGEHLALQAKANPRVGFIGCEPFINGIAGLVTKIHEQGLHNVRIYPDDARHVLEALKHDSIDQVFLLHPDPWPKTRHAKRRFVSEANLNALARVMKKGAELRIGTDHPTYMAWTMVQMQHRADFKWTAERAADWHTPPADWYETRYAAKAKKSDARCVYLTFVRT